MTYEYNLTFTGFLRSLISAGVETGSARGFWGGISKSGDIVVTSWLPDRAEGRPLRRFIWKPTTNHGGLKSAWESGALSIGAKVKLILVRSKAKPGEPGQVGGAAVQPGFWQVVEIFERDGHQLAWIEPAAS